jgi:hypothetical protein
MFNRTPRVVREYDWESLEEGETKRLHCDSPKCEGKVGKALTITRTSTGCIYNCYRCGLPGSPGVIGTVSNPSQALRRIKEMRNERHAHNNDSDYILGLPYDFINLLEAQMNNVQVPAQAYAWIYKYELDDDDIYNYNIGYSSKLERVIIPIYNNTELIAWQGRDIYYNKNKELFKNNKLDKIPLKYYTEYNKYKYNNNKIYFKILNNIKYNILILVEDIISGIKVYNKFKNIGAGVITLLNSTIHDKLVQDLNLTERGS